jgi:hypothetical protein
MLLNIRVTAQEMNELKKISTNFGYNLSEYVRRRLFAENQDFNDKETIYINPNPKKHNLLMITMLCKMFYMITDLLEKQGYTTQHTESLEKSSLEYARKQREKHGYKIITPEDIARE